MNNALMIAKNLPMLLKNRGVVAFFSLAVFLSIGAIVASYYLLDSRDKAMEVEQEIQRISSYMGDYRKKEAELKAAHSRPVEAKEVDGVQTDVLLLMQSCHVQIVDLKVVNDSGTKESQSVVYNEGEKTTAGEKEAAKAGQQSPNAGDAAQGAVAQKRKEPPHRSYDAKLRGTYENIMAFVQKFGVRGKLLTIRKFTMAPMDDGTYVADVRYKIYVKQ